MHSSLDRWRLTNSVNGYLIAVRGLALSHDHITILSSNPAPLTHTLDSIPPRLLHDVSRLFRQGAY